MAHIANMHEAKTHFSRLVAAAQAGEEVIVAKAGEPLVRLVPVTGTAERTVGPFRGAITGDIVGPVAISDRQAWS